MKLGDEALVKLVDVVKSKYDTNGKQLSRALDDTLKEELDERMPSSDKLMIRNQVTDLINARFARDFWRRRSIDVLVVGAERNRKRYSIRDLQAGAEVEDRRDQLCMELHPEQDGAA